VIVSCRVGSGSYRLWSGRFGLVQDDPILGAGRGDAGRGGSGAGHDKLPRPPGRGGVGY
jgi:hypothetical protein